MYSTGQRQSNVEHEFFEPPEPEQLNSGTELDSSRDKGAECEGALPKGWLRVFPHLVIPEAEAVEELVWVDAGHRDLWLLSIAF